MLSRKIPYRKLQHRINGPYEYYSNGYKAWWVNDKRYRLDGPAIEYAFGSKEWWVDSYFIQNISVFTNLIISYNKKD